MGDHVHFLGRDVPAFPSDGCCGNGFGVPFNDGSNDPPRYPVAVPVVDCETWYWYAKNWSLATDFSYTDGITTNLSSGTMTPVSGHTRELDLVTALSGNTFDIGNTATDDCVLALFNGGAFDASPALKFVDPDLSPALIISGNVGDLNFSSRSDAFSPPDGSITATVDGKAVAVYYKNNGSGTFVATQLDFTIVETWPYA